jgi:hypothetical protein
MREPKNTAAPVPMSIGIHVRQVASDTQPPHLADYQILRYSLSTGGLSPGSFSLLPIFLHSDSPLAWMVRFRADLQPSYLNVGRKIILEKDDLRQG